MMIIMMIMVMRMIIMIMMIMTMILPSKAHFPLDSLGLAADINCVVIGGGEGG